MNTQSSAMAKAVTPAEALALLKRSTGRIKNVAAKQDRTYAGRVYHSKSEARYAFELDMQKVTGKIKDWTPQHPIELCVNGNLICKMIADFLVYYPDGSQALHEVKGWETPEYKLKRKLLKAVYPALDYRVVKVGRK